MNHVRAHNSGVAVASDPVAAGVPVRYAEGSEHGFLQLTTADGTLIAHGDQLQIERNGEVTTRMIFYLASGSVFEETVTFTQRGTFEMQSYHLVQSGPAFGDDIDATFRGRANTSSALNRTRTGRTTSSRARSRWRRIFTTEWSRRSQRISRRRMRP